MDIMKEINDDEAELMDEIEHHIKTMSDVCTTENEDTGTLGTFDIFVKTVEDLDFSTTESDLSANTDCTLKILNTFSLKNKEDWKENENIVNLSDKSKEVSVIGECSDVEVDQHVDTGDISDTVTKNNHPLTLSLNMECYDVEDDCISDDMDTGEKVRSKEIDYGCKTKKAKTFICKLCNKAFTSEGFLKRHKLQFHCGGSAIAVRKGKYQCEMCQNRFGSQSGLTQPSGTQTGGQQKCKLTKCTVRLTDILKSTSSSQKQTNKIIGGVKSGTPQRKYRPGRYCIYCKKILKGGKLRRHIKRKHKTNPEVAEILKLPKCKQLQFFNSKRLEGINEFNLTSVKAVDENLNRERNPKLEDHVRVFSGCKEKVSNKFFYKHKCVSQDKFPTKLQIQEKNKTVLDTDKESTTILNKSRDGEVGELCRAEETMKTKKPVRYCIYCKKMIEGGKLSRHIKRKHKDNPEVAEILQQPVSKQHQFFDTKRCEGIYEFNLSLISADDENLMREKKTTGKYEDHVRVCSGCKKFISKKSFYKHKCVSQDKFPMKLQVLQKNKTVLDNDQEFTCTNILNKFRDREVGDFCRADGTIKTVGYRHFILTRHEKERHPRNTLEELEVQKLKNFICGQLADTVENFTVEKYRWLQTLIIGRLTLYNARRRVDPSRITCKEFQEAVDDAQLPPHEVDKINDEAEQYLVSQFRRANLKTDINKYVPVMIPNDLLPGWKLLLENRDNYGIKRDNFYLFGTKSSRSHVSGWRALNDICREALVDIPMNAYEERHWLSTICVSLDMNPQQQQIFLDHIGLDCSINKDDNLAPPGERPATDLGRMNDSRIDESENSSVIIQSQAEKANNSSLIIQSQAEKVNNSSVIIQSQAEKVNNSSVIIQSQAEKVNYERIDETDDVPEDLEGKLKKTQQQIKFYKDKLESTEKLLQESAENFKKLQKELEISRLDSQPNADKISAMEDSDWDGMENKITVRWSRKDTETLRTVFKECVFENGESNKGDLPSKEEILEFLDKYKPKSVQGLNREEQYRKTRTKVFNERKTLRLKAELKQKQLQNTEVNGVTLSNPNGEQQ